MVTVTSPTKVDTPATFKFCVVVRPVTPKLPSTASLVPSNVNLELSSNSPLAPAMTTRLSVRSEILAVLATRPEPPDTSNPPLASITPAKVETPDTLRSSNSV